MANIYGQSQQEKQLLKMCPEEIEKFDDVERTWKTLKEDLHIKNTGFNERLPHIKAKEKEELKAQEKNKDKKSDEWDKKIEYNRSIIKDNKKLIIEKHKIHYTFFLLANYIKLGKNKYSKSSSLRKIDKEIENRKEIIEELENNPQSVFERENKDLISKIDELLDLMQTKEYVGAQGEIIVLEQLKKLPETFHVFCDISMSLDDYVRHADKTRSLKSAQMDFVVVGNTGIFNIEVKNWADKFYRQWDGMSPHEQADRAGQVLFIKLKKRLSFSPPCKKVLVSVKDNMKPDRNFGFVYVTSPSYIKKYIENMNNKISHKDVEEAASVLKNYLNN